MIPKVIHYCWVGGKPLPELAQKCIESWKRFCPDYEIKRWDESNYDFNKCKYMSDAYREKKWGFVPDYARFEIIYKFGGIYLDTDVEVLKPLDDLLDNTGIMGFESSSQVNGGLIIAGEPGIPVFRELYEIYDAVNFYNEDGSLNLVASPHYNTDILKRHGLDTEGLRDGSIGGGIQCVAGITVYPTEYFCPKDYRTGALNITENTYTIYHFDGSWCSDAMKKLAKEKEWIQRNIKIRFLNYILRKLCVLKKVILEKLHIY